MAQHPDNEALNAIASIIMKHHGWIPLNLRYAIANDVLNWFDARKESEKIVKHIVEYIESERGWGTNIDQVAYFDTEQEAITAVKQCNKNLPSGPAPDYYYIARYVGAEEVYVKDLPQKKQGL